MPQTTPAGHVRSAAAFSFPAVRGKKVTAAFDGGRLTSDGPFAEAQIGGDDHAGSLVEVV